MSGQFRLRAEGDDYGDYASYRDFFLLRVRPRFSVSRTDFELVFTPQFARTLGEPQYATQVNTGVPARVSTSGSTVDPSFGVHEAFATYFVSDALHASGGRMIVGYGDELVIGALEWNNVGRSFDGFRARWAIEPGWIDVFAMKLAENNSFAPASPDRDLFGLYSHFLSAPWLRDIEFYFLNQRAPQAGTVADLYVVGFRNAAKTGSIDRRVEATLETGEGTPLPQNPFQADVELGYRFESAGGPRFAAEYFVAGEGYSQLFPTAHKWLGFADVLGRRNLSGFALHGEFAASDALKLRADFHRFQRYSLDAPVFKIDGVTALGSVSGSGSGDVGSEIDLTATYSLSGAAALTGGFSYFAPGEYLQNQFGTRTPLFYFVQLELTY